MIRIVCPACGAKGNAAEKLAGRTIPCPRCKAPLSIPAATAAASPARREPDDEDQPYRLAGEPPESGSGDADMGGAAASTSAASVFERAGRRQSAPLESTGSATAAFAPVARKRKRRKRSAFEDPSA